MSDAARRCPTVRHRCETAKLDRLTLEFSAEPASGREASKTMQASKFSDAQKAFV
jgi:hypothetical protein